MIYDDKPDYTYTMHLTSAQHGTAVMPTHALSVYSLHDLRTMALEVFRYCSRRVNWPMTICQARSQGIRTVGRPPLRR